MMIIFVSLYLAQVELGW